MNLNEGPGTDMKVPVQNSVCCLLKLDPLSGWRPHDAQEDDISMELYGRRSRGSPDAQSFHSSHLQGRSEDVSHWLTSSPAAGDLPSDTQPRPDTHFNFILVKTQKKQHPNTSAVAYVSSLV